jgi:hypothetical protein
VDFQPACLFQHLAFALERLTGHARDARGHEVFGGRIENGEKAPHHEVVQLLLGFVQVLGCERRGNDREVVRDLRVVEDPLIRLHPLLLEDLRCVGRVRKGGTRLAFRAAGQRLQRLVDGPDIVLGQRARIGARIREHLVFFVQRLRDRERHAGRKSEPPVRGALQARQVEEER